MHPDRPNSSIPAAELVDRLRRWEESGATWHVLSRSDRAVTVALCRCDDGEEVDRLRSEDPAAVALLRGRTGSADRSGADGPKRPADAD